MVHYLHRRSASPAELRASKGEVLLRSWPRTAGPHAEYEPSAGQGVDGCRLLCQLFWASHRCEEHSRSRLDAMCRGGSRGQD